MNLKNINIGIIDYTNKDYSVNGFVQIFGYLWVLQGSERLTDFDIIFVKSSLSSWSHNSELTRDRNLLMSEIRKSNGIGNCFYVKLVIGVPFDVEVREYLISLIERESLYESFLSSRDYDTIKNEFYMLLVSESKYVLSIEDVDNNDDVFDLGVGLNDNDNDGFIISSGPVTLGENIITGSSVISLGADYSLSNATNSSLLELMTENQSNFLNPLYYSTYKGWYSVEGFVHLLDAVIEALSKQEFLTEELFYNRDLSVVSDEYSFYDRMGVMIDVSLIPIDLEEGGGSTMVVYNYDSCEVKGTIVFTSMPEEGYYSSRMRATEIKGAVVSRTESESSKLMDIESSFRYLLRESIEQINSKIRIKKDYDVE